MRKQMLFGLVADLVLIGMISMPARAQTTWTDPATGLMWTNQDNGADINWDQARSYCANLRLGGYSGWRMATIEELKAIDDPSLGEFRHIKGGIRLTSPEAISVVWSSSDGGLPSWGLAYYYARENHGQGIVIRTINIGLRTLCVRRP